MPPGPVPPRTVDAVLLLALALSLAALASSFVQARRAAGLDFYQFWVVAQAAGRADVADIYDYDTRARLGAEYVGRAATDEDSPRRRAVAGAWPVLEPTATPFFYAAFRPLAHLTYERAFLLFSLASLASLTAGTLLLARLAGLTTAEGLLLLAFLGLAFQPLHSDIRVGNVNQLQIGLLALYAWLSARPDRSRLQMAAGALLGLLVLFKPNLAPLVPLLAACWFWRGRPRKLVLQSMGLAGGGLIALAAAWAVFGSARVWARWLDYLSGLPPAKIPLSYGNVGLGRLLFEAVGEDVSSGLALAALAAVLACLWRVRRRGAPGGDLAPLPVEDLAALAAGALVYLLSAPIVWTHYLLFALPAVILLLRAPRGYRAALAVLALVVVAIDPWADPLGAGDLRLQAAVVALGLLLLFVLVCRSILGWGALPAPSTAATMPAGGEP